MVKGFKMLRKSFEMYLKLMRKSFKPQNWFQNHENGQKYHKNCSEKHLKHSESDTKITHNLKEMFKIFFRIVKGPQKLLEMIQKLLEEDKNCQKYCKKIN